MNGTDGHHIDIIDRAIDEAARGLTAGEPGAALTMRVLARIQRRPSRWRWQLAADPLNIAVAVTIVIVAVWMRPWDRRPAATTPSAPTIAEAGRPPVAPDALTSSPARGIPTLLDANAATRLDARKKSSSSQALSAPAGAPSASAGARSASAGAPSQSDGSVVATLAPPPLDAPSIVLPSLEAGASIDVQALVSLEPIIVAPLDQPEGDQP